MLKLETPNIEKTKIKMLKTLLHWLDRRVAVRSRALEVAAQHTMVASSERRAGRRTHIRQPGERRKVGESGS